jgi:cysteinyl-tRNA synthetase
MNLEKEIKMDKKEKVIFFNTLGRELQEFTPLPTNHVGMYTCGPTVYGRAHIGNLRAYTFADIARRVLEYAGYNVKHVMNITDVGHLTSNADEGEDKLQKAARETHQTAWEISKKWTTQFLKDVKELNIQPVHVICKATDHIPDQIKLIKKLEEKGYTYKTSDGIYFDTSKFPRYGELARLDIKGLQAGKRIEMGEKRNKTDFALWKFSKPEENRDMEWDSPWGRGFPGWHIECSAMSMKYLGETFDIHTGGIDHIPIHHTNEIAQSEAATGKKFVNYWLHSEFLVMSNKEKMSKSVGNIVNLDTLKSNKIPPLAYRYLCLNTHYRKPLIYGSEILNSAKTTYFNLIRKVMELKGENSQIIGLNQLSTQAEKYLVDFKKAVFNDLNTPRALGIMWDLIKENSITPSEKYSLLLDFDRVFGLRLSEIAPSTSQEKEIPQNILELFNQRNKFRLNKEWVKADELRDQLKKEGYQVVDTKEGAKLERI